MKGKDLIETLWNVKELALDEENLEPIDLIETLWNVKFFYIVQW